MFFHHIIECVPASKNEYLVDENELKKCLSLKNNLDRKRTIKSVAQTISVTFKMCLFYADIITDVRLASDYWNKNNIISSMITLFFVIFSWILRIVFLVSSHYEIILKKWKASKVNLVIRLLCPKMIYWYFMR